MISLELIKKIAPETIEIIGKRYNILRNILYNQPIGRRMLSLETGIKERAIRDEVNILKNLGLLNIDLMGMYVTESGEGIIEDLKYIYGELKGIPKLERQLEEVLQVKKVVVIPGVSSNNELVLKDMGKVTSNILKDTIKDKDIVGITGGNTMATVVDEVVSDNKSRDIIVVPARGSLGQGVETQANSIAAKLGQSLGGRYRLLYIPDSLDEEALEVIIKNEEIKKSVELINNMNTLVFGIGRADTMAKRRNLSDDKIGELLNKGSVAEAFGHYFDIKGKEIWEYKTIGMSLKKFKELDNVIAVAGGEDKAEAIIAVSTLQKNMTIITDEDAGKRILELVK